MAKNSALAHSIAAAIVGALEPFVARLEAGGGTPGEQGPAGADGAPGENGVMGMQGEPGEKGDKGDVGDVGMQGPAGADGAPGEQGPAGADGAPGEQGPAGADGAPGEVTISSMAMALVAVKTGLASNLPADLQPEADGPTIVAQINNICAVIRTWATV